MLLRFGVSNFLSFSDYQELSLEASAPGEMVDDLIDCPAAVSGAVTPALVLYGANGSGKSNLLEAMECLREAIVEIDSVGTIGTKAWPEPFLLTRSPDEGSTRLQIDFILDGVRHHYGFDASSELYESEWLHTFPDNQRQLVFQRERSRYEFGPSLKGRKKTIANNTPPDRLFLSAAGQDGHKTLMPVCSYFDAMSFIPAAAFEIAGSSAMDQMFAEDPHPRTIQFLQEAGTGVVGYRLNEEELPETYHTVVNQMSDIIAEQGEPPVPVNAGQLSDLLPESGFSLQLAHCGTDGNPVYLPLHKESSGTRRLLTIMNRVYAAIDRGHPLVVDGLEENLHPQVSEAILRLFCSRSTNPRGAQLVTTTHQTALMKSRLLRSDQIWFAEKESYGATEIYPLSEYEPDPSDDVEQAYLQGRFEAVPDESVLSIPDGEEYRRAAMKTPKT